MTKERIMESYNGAQYEDLFDAYERPSYRKIQSWRNIERTMDALNGWGLRVCGFNSCTYSAGFKYQDKETGETRLRYYTHANVYEVLDEYGHAGVQKVA